MADDKTFTQAELDKIVAERLARETEKHAKAIKDLEAAHATALKGFGDHEALKMAAEEAKGKLTSVQAELQTVQQAKADLEARQTKAAEAQKAMREKALGLVPDDKKSLLQHVPEEDQTAYVLANLNHFQPNAPAPKPSTPPPDKLPENENAKWGGYASREEFATKDAAGYQAAKAKGQFSTQ